MGRIKKTSGEKVDSSIFDAAKKAKENKAKKQKMLDAAGASYNRVDEINDQLDKQSDPTQKYDNLKDIFGS